MLTLKNDFEKVWENMNASVCIQKLRGLGLTPQDIYLGLTGQKETFAIFCKKYRLNINV